MDRRSAGDERSDEDQTLGVVRRAIAVAAPPSVEDDMRQVLRDFREDLADHPYLRASRARPASRALRWPWLAASALAAGCLIVAIALVIELPGPTSDAPSGARPVTAPPPVTDSAVVSSEPVREVIADGQIVWWAATSDCVVAVWKDGSAACWSLATGRRISHFRIAGFNYRHFRCFAPLDSPQLAVVDVTTQNVRGKLSKSIRLYDLRTGKLTKTIRGLRYTGQGKMGPRIVPITTLSMKGVSPDGRYLFGASTLGRVVFAIDLEAGKLAWQFPLPEGGAKIGSNNVMFGPYGKIVLIISTPDGSLPGGDERRLKHCTAYSSTGRVLWEYEVTGEDTYLKPYKVAGVEESVVFCLRQLVRRQGRLVAPPLYLGFNAKGKPIWKHDKLVLAISPNGKQVVVGDKAWRYHRSFARSDTHATNAPSRFGPTGMAFASGGKLLLKLPNVVYSRVDKGGDIAYEVTPNYKLQVVDHKTGRTLREIKLTKPPPPTPTSKPAG